MGNDMWFQFHQGASRPKDSGTAAAVHHGRAEGDGLMNGHMVFLHRMRSLPFEQVREFDITAIEKILAQEEKE